jgi:hypothetical protein
MKKLAARDWEDLLQVYCPLTLVGHWIDNILFLVCNPSFRKTFTQFNSRRHCPEALIRVSNMAWHGKTEATYRNHRPGS